ncbi:TRAP transporter small permease subunit [Hyphobacterium sp.]|jgi:TRAP-type mannitol/chloroaromatic compound transport system permease small subunit|uniref:TRAP transporter small permease subunit n=1 Tax=Hyphobacterium sp. TaxID=2004662 RepID=UPI003BAA0970
MRWGDALLLLIVGLALAMTIADAISGAGLSGWIAANLYPLARSIGGGLAMAGWILAPFLLLPLLMALAGGFFGLPDQLAGVARRIISLFDAFSMAVGDAARWFALGLVIVTATVVIQRYVFGFASTKLQESIIYLHALLFLLSAGSTLLADGHVRVDIVYSKLSERGKAWTDLIGTYLALFPMALLILWVSTPYINASWRILERSRESDGLPLVFVLKTAIPVFAVLLIIQGSAMALRAALTLAGRTAPPAPEATEAEA